MFFSLGIALTALGALLLARHFATHRSYVDVLGDLAGDDRANTRDGNQILASISSRASIAQHKEKNNLSAELCCLMLGVCLCLLVSLQLSFSTYSSIMSGIVCAAISYLVLQRTKRHKQIRSRDELEFFLPLVMERVVMAVQAGFDIVAALHRIVELEDKGLDATERDPVTLLISRVCDLTDAGLSFRQALAQVSSSCPSTAIKHAFLHLGLAYEQGGELVMPLSELSDSTQLYYQDSAEEQIAKMPVRATLPLVITFCGLIIFFLSSPILQVVNMLSGSLSNFEGAGK